MIKTILKKLIPYSLLISLLLHLLLMLSFTIAFFFEPPQMPPMKTPDLFIPSYVQQETPPTPQQQMKQPEPLTDKLALEKPKPPNPTPQQQPAKPVAQQKTPKDDPVHLIGNKKESEKSLVAILGKAMTKHLVYPKVAMDFFIRGRALIGFTVHPDGQITDVELLVSSGTGVLDEAALNAAKNMSPVKQASEYVSSPTYMRIGVFFG